MAEVTHSRTFPLNRLKPRHLGCTLVYYLKNYIRGLCYRRYGKYTFNILVAFCLRFPEIVILIYRIYWYRNWLDRNFLMQFWLLEIRHSLLQHADHLEHSSSNWVPQASGKESFCHMHWLHIHQLSLITWCICITLFYMFVPQLEVPTWFFGVLYSGLQHLVSFLGGCSSIPSFE